MKVTKICSSRFFLPLSHTRLSTFLVTTFILGLAVIAIPSKSYALMMSAPCDITGCDKGGWNGVPGPGPSDPSLGGTTMPPGGDGRPPREDIGNDKEPSPKKVKSFGRVRAILNPNITPLRREP
jgi:hypothetical protein